MNWTLIMYLDNKIVDLIKSGIVHSHVKRNRWIFFKNFSKKISFFELIILTALIVSGMELVVKFCYA